MGVVSSIAFMCIMNIKSFMYRVIITLFMLYLYMAAQESTILADKECTEYTLQSRRHCRKSSFYVKFLSCCTCAAERLNDVKKSLIQRSKYFFAYLFH